MSVSPAPRWDPCGHLCHAVQPMMLSAEAPKSWEQFRLGSPNVKLGGRILKICFSVCLLKMGVLLCCPDCPQIPGLQKPSCLSLGLEAHILTTFCVPGAKVRPSIWSWNKLRWSGGNAFPVSLGPPLSPEHPSTTFLCPFQGFFSVPAPRRSCCPGRIFSRKLRALPRAQRAGPPCPG